MAGTYTKDMVEHGYTIKHIGHEADVTVFSFQAVKNLPTADGGMICFQDVIFDKLARQLSWLGIDKDTYSRFNKGSYKWKYDVPNIGFKYHGNALTAAIGIVQLKYLNEDNTRRNEISKLYSEHLSNLDWCSIVETSPETEINSKHLFQLLVYNNRDKFIEYLYGNEIYPGVHYIDNRCYLPYNTKIDLCPNATKLSDQVVTLPIHCNLSNEDVHNVIKKIKDWK
jgi:dTDP-4-amino-4,6-dideoxygalactose transaminase